MTATAKNKTIKKVPEDLWWEVKSAAANESKTVNEWLLDAIRAKLGVEVDRYLYGWTAIGFAKTTGRKLSKLPDPIEGERVEDVSPEEAEQMLQEELPEDFLFIHRY